MPITLKFFDWSQPALPQTAGWLTATFGHGRRLDLRKVVVAVPGGQVRRRLLELLVAEAADRGWELLPGRIITAGELPELLYDAHKPFANELTQQLAWVDVLKAAGRERLAPLLRDPPADDDLTGWLTLGQMLAQLHRELAADDFDCEDILRHGSDLEEFNETERWKLLAALQQEYHALLDRLGLWDKQTARLFAIKHRECRAKAAIVLVGMVDLNRSQRRMLDQVSDRVTALVFAPPDAADRFDEHGCLIESKWQQAPIDLLIERIEIAAGPAEQADAAVRALASLGGKYAADEITIGVADARLVPYLRQRLDEAEAPARYGAGAPLSRSGPLQLLAEGADYLERGRFRDLAALARHPALGAWLTRQPGIEGDWLTALDDYFSKHLPDELSDEAPPRLDRSSGGVRQVQGRISALFAPLRGKAQPLTQWSQPILDLFGKVYGDRRLNENDEADRIVLAACAGLRGALEEHVQIPRDLMPRVTGVEALRLALRAVESATIPPRSDRAAIELRGWLELPWDDAPALVATGMNEGLVPASGRRDLFLPDTLRRRLKLDDSARRYARDAYALGLLAASRRELRLVAGRRTADGEPLVPSRLLFACGDGELAPRARRLFGPPLARPRMRLAGSPRAGQSGGWRIVVPQPAADPCDVEAFKVTEFRDYIACPYRYYLRHRLRLEAMDDTAAELDGREFGSLMHEVLQRFSDGAVEDSAESEEIRRELGLVLGKLAAERFGAAPLPAVRVQIEMLRLRLEAFADKQAEHRAAGWEICAVEKKFEAGEVLFDVDGRPVSLVGRVDRIDVNKKLNAVAVLDYKSSESASSPDAVHRSGRGAEREWVDLQLPLYRHLVRGIMPKLVADGPVQLGYVLLPGEISKTGFAVAEWSDGELAAADEVARDVVRRVRSGEFWPPADPAPTTFPELAAICQEDVFAAAAAEVAPAGQRAAADSSGAEEACA